MASTLQGGVACWPAPSQSVTPGRALFAKGLAKGCTSAHLQSIFSAFGTVTDCQIARHRSGRSAGFAIVTFLRHEEAVAAMQAMDNFLYMGRRLSVKWFSPERALEGGSHSVDVLNMQTLQHALQLSAQLQPADLMAHLAQMLESPRIVPPQPQNPHVAAWLDNFMLAQQRDSPLAPALPDPTQQPSQLDLLNFSALSLTDLPPQNLSVPPGPGFGINPATPSSLDVPDGAVFVTASANAASNKAGGAAATGNLSASANASANANASNLVLAHSRLAKWCAAPGPGSAGGRSSAAQSLADDASSDETASVHASDDSSVATTTAPTLANGSCDAPSCSTEGSSPAGQHLVLSEAGVPMAASTTVIPGSTPAAPPGTPSSACGVAAATPTTCMPGIPEPEDVLRGRVYAAAAAAGFPTAGVLPGVPPLPPLRTVTPAGPAGVPHQQHHLPRGALAHQSRAAMPVFSSCGGGGAAAAAAAAAAASPDACIQHALRLQQALAEQARTMNAQQQYVDALAKFAAAREQVMAAASLLNSSGNGGMATTGLQVPTALAAAAAHSHHPHMAAAAAPPPTAAGPMGAYMSHMAAAPAVGVNPYLATPAAAPAGVPGPVPDLSTLLMFQNAASMSRPLY
ncbi:hypothetical protein Vretifemale_15241 [Volvox reticuliferus]|uniref:RRM domain-containing protein n=1 Tax=Volvox reticuliferus TaxID=1737510 RepID=A0A8J4FRF3_9CHLO|nr:hypothetical protein Vretifemale_15241 [Volvox reticuliferus]